jgi:acetate kinase
MPDNSPTFQVSGLYASMPEYATLYALPYELSAPAIRRKGMDSDIHALILERARQLSLPSRRLVSIRLGDAPTLVAFMDGQALDTSTGYSPCEGIPSTTTCGDIDPSLALLLCRQGWPPGDVRRLLTRESGWQAVAGRTGSLVELLETSQLVHQMLQAVLLKAIGASLAVLGGGDCLVLAAENAQRWLPFVQELLARISFLGTWLQPALEIKSGTWQLHRPSSAMASYIFEIS